MQLALWMGWKWTNDLTMPWYEHMFNVYTRFEQYYNVLMPVSSLFMVFYIWLAL